MIDSFTRPVEERSDQELFEILVEECSFRQDVVKAAKSELQKRGLSEFQINKIVSDRQTTIEKELAIEETKMANESLDLFEWIHFIILFPFSIFDDWGLAGEGYIKKSRQRTFAFFCGLLCWLVATDAVIVFDSLQNDEIKSSVNEPIRLKGQHRYHNYLILVLESNEPRLNIADFIQTSNLPYEEWPKPIDAFFVNDSLQIVGDMHRLPARALRSKFVQIWPAATTTADTIFSSLGKIRLKDQHDSIHPMILRRVRDRNVIPP